MESSKPAGTNQEEEIDLLQIFTKFILFVKVNIASIGIAFLMGCLLGGIYFLITPKIYESKLLISSDILTESYSKSLIDNVDKLIIERNILSLSKKLSLSEDHASKIGKIEIKSALEKPGDTPETSKMYLAIEAKVRDNSFWPQLENGIVNYLQNNEFVKIRVEQRKRYINQVIEKINLELVDLEKLKTRIAEGSLTKSSKENLILFDPTTVNSKILELNKEIINLQNSLEIVNSIQVIEGFTVFNNPTSPKLTIAFSIGVFLGFFFVAIFIAFKAIRAIWRLPNEASK